MNKQEFLEELNNLEIAFQKLSPELELTVRDSVLGVEGYVVVSNTFAAIENPLGRFGKGGTRVGANVSLEEIRMLANVMTLKNSAAGLPLGGAKSGLKVDPKDPNFEIKFRRFVNLVKHALVENGGSWGGFGFDIGMQTAQLIWACEEAKSTRCATGKPIEMGGTDYDREGIAGLGVAVSAMTALKELGENISEANFVVQGAGAMGAAVIKYFSEYGANLKAVSDPRLGGAFKLKHQASKSLIESLAEQDFENTIKLLSAEAEKLNSLEEIIFVDCDVLFPAAVQNVIDRNNVDQISCKYLIEAANSPCTADARDLIHKREILLIPDFIANPGGIIAAYIEMTSEVGPEENARTKQNVVDAKNYTRDTITENTKKLLEIVKDLKVSPYQAGRYLALSRVFNNAQELIHEKF